MVPDGNGDVMMCSQSACMCVIITQEFFFFYYFYFSIFPFFLRMLNAIAKCVNVAFCSGKILSEYFLFSQFIYVLSWSLR